MQQLLKQCDFNQFKILCSLVHTGSTHESARQLGISQSTVSRTLGKLRETYGETLFLRHPHGLEPSALAKELAVVIEQMLDNLQGVQSQFQQFEPFTYSGTLKIVVNRSTLAVCGAEISVQLARALPKVDFILIGWDHDALEKLVNGEYHYGIQTSQAKLPKRLHRELLLEDEFMLVARRGHPGLQTSFVLRDLDPYPLVRLYLPQINTLDSSPAELVLRRWGFSGRIQLKTDDIHTLVGMLKHQDAILPTGSRLVARIDPALQVYPFSKGVVPDTKFKLFGIYPADRRNQPLYNYLDKSLRSLLTGMQKEGNA